MNISKWWGKQNVSGCELGNRASIASTTTSSHSSHSEGKHVFVQCQQGQCKKSWLPKYVLRSRQTPGEPGSGKGPARMTSSITEQYLFEKDAIGSGAFGTVFRAKHKARVHAPTVAVKVVKINTRKRASAFLKEVAAMEKLNHPNICRLVESYKAGSLGFLVLEYCEGGELFRRICSNGGMTEARTADIIKQVAAAVQYAHRCGVIHRDLKPENICFCTGNPSDTCVKVVDWGSASCSLERMTACLGTSGYCAPEVLKASVFRSYTRACDAFSLGALTYVTLSARHAFTGSTSKLLTDIKQEKYLMSGSPWDAVSSDAISFIRGLLKPRPELRTSIDDAVTHSFLTHAGPKQPAVPQNSGMDGSVSPTLMFEASVGQHRQNTHCLNSKEAGCLAGIPRANRPPCGLGLVASHHADTIGSFSL